MHLTEDTFRLYAAKYYDNPYCLTEKEFEEDLDLIRLIKRLLTNSIRHKHDNKRIILNNVIQFYNVFDQHAASTMLDFKLSKSQKLRLNSVLYYLSMPLLADGKFDLLFHRELAQELKRFD